MMDRIEHTEHKRRDREATHASGGGDRRYGGTWADSADRDADEHPDNRP